MTPEGTVHEITTSLLLGIQFDEYDFRLFLENYYADLDERVDDEFPGFDPAVVLDELIPQYDTDGEETAGGRFDALRSYAQRTEKLDLALTGSDYGKLEQRQSPYTFDRMFYHVGRELVSADVRVDHPGYNPYRSTRELSIPFVRSNLDELLELLPDYLWWEMHDQRDAIAAALLPEKMDDVRQRLESAEFKLDNFGLYLATREYVLVPEDK